MDSFNSEEIKSIQGCRVLTQSVEQDLRDEFKVYFSETYIKLEEFKKNTEEKRLEGYNGFAVDIPQNKRKEFAAALKKSIESLKADIHKFKIYPFSKVVTQSPDTVSFFFAFQKNPTDFNNMNKETKEETMMLDSKDAKTLYEEESAEYKKRRHY